MNPQVTAYPANTHSHSQGKLLPTTNNRHDECVQLLYENLHALPSEEFGAINLLPFAHDTDQTRMVRRQVCEAIADLLDRHGLLNHQAAQTEPILSSETTIKCLSCATDLIQVPTTSDGLARVNAALFISTISRLNPDCGSAHRTITPDDLRTHLEDQFRAQLPDDEEGA